MEPERWRLVQEVFAAAAELPPLARDAFLGERTEGDEELRREVESLLAADADSESDEFLEQPALPGRLSQILADGPSDKAEGRIGPYRLLRKLGEGGMSRVYLAIRDDGFQRLVALKVIRRGLKSEDLLHRFRTERQILAGLDHPNIAKLLDGGSTEEGLPYFVMEHIDGIPVDEYCDRNRLTVFQRLQLFLDICAAVQYAHQNLVVHRDIKTSNILVTADGTAKLLDFGIAKLLKPEQFPVPVELTATMMRPMTPFYASPEQIQGRAITTASDVYSLGVLLYKLLTGHLPYQVESHTAKEVERAVVETPPERPSTAVSRVETIAAGRREEEITITPASVSQARSVQPNQLRRILTGDLDTILLAALRKEPRRRYGTVEQFAEDVRRSLDGLPVRAHGDSLGYRARKFVQRNRVPIGVGATIVLLLFGFAVTMALQASRIALERDAAQRERDRAEQVVTFLQDIFRVSDPHEEGGATITAREILDSGAQRVTRELEDQPEVQATLMQAIGNVYRNLGLYDLAEPLLREALSVRRRALGKDHPAVAQSLNNLGVVLRQRGDYDGAAPLFNEALEMRRRHHAGVNHPDLAESLNNLALLYQERGRYPVAEELMAEAIAIQRAAEGGSGAELASLLANMGILLTEVGDWIPAEPPFREALQLRREALGEDHPLVADSLNDLGVFLGIQGDLEAAEELLREALTMRRHSLNPDHPALAESINNLGRLLREKRDFPAAEELYREALAIREKQLGRDHRLVAIHIHNLGQVLQAQRKLAQAEVQLRDALAIRIKLFGEEHNEVGVSYMALGDLLVEQGRAANAEPLLRKGVEVMSATLPPNHWRIAQAESALGACLTALGRYRDAEPLLLSGYENLSARRGPNHRRTQVALDHLIELYDSTDRIAEAD
ncbi:MAG: tetratricopeptide repeat protein, partial [Thermoanaerobaculia bacterium]